MKVALVSSGSGSRGGGEIYLRFLAEGLRLAGHGVHALVPAASRMDDLARSLEPHATVERLNVTSTYDRRLRNIAAVLDRRQQQQVAARLLELSPDIVHVNQQVAEDGLDFLLAAVRSCLPWVSTIHIARSASALGARFGRLRDIVTAETLRGHQTAVIAVSSASMAQLQSRFGQRVRAPRIHVVHNGVPGVDPEQLRQARNRARSDWGAGARDLVIGTVGRIEAQKNPLALIDYVAPLAEDGRSIRLVWIGDGAMRDELQLYGRSSGRGVPLNVDGWRVDAALRMAGFDIFLLPSLYEGLPLALLEAMHAGLPVIAARTDGTPEAVRHGETGFLCRTGEDWLTALRTLANDPEIRAQLGAAARIAARERFSIEAMARATAAVYEVRVQMPRPVVA